MLYVQYSRPSNQKAYKQAIARLLLLPIGEQLRSVVLVLLSALSYALPQVFALDNKKHISACVGHANIGASTLGVGPRCHSFSSSICSGRYSFNRSRHTHSNTTKFFFLSKPLLRSPLFYLDKPAFAWKSTFRAAPNFRKYLSFPAINPRVFKVSFKFETSIIIICSLLVL